MSFAEVFHLHRVLHRLHEGSRVHGLHNAVGCVDLLIESKVYLLRFQENRLILQFRHCIIDRIILFDRHMILFKISAQLRREFTAGDKESRLVLRDQGKRRCEHISVIRIFADIEEPCDIVKT